MRAVDQAIKDYILKEFMADKPARPLDNDLPLLQEGIIDSLGVFLLVGFLEEHFGIKIQEEDVVLENFATVNTITSLISAKLSPAASN